MSSKPSDDIQREIFTLLNKHWRPNACWSFINDAEEIMESEDGVELVRLFQKWLASV